MVYIPFQKVGIDKKKGIICPRQSLRSQLAPLVARESGTVRLRPLLVPCAAKENSVPHQGLGAG